MRVRARVLVRVLLYVHFYAFMERGACVRVSGCVSARVHVFVFNATKPFPFQFDCTGGLKDTVFEYLPNDPTSDGNGFTFEAHTVGDFVYAVKRAMAVFSEPEQYMRLRACARASVLDTAVVAEAWTRYVKKHTYAHHTCSGHFCDGYEYLSLYTCRRIGS